MSHISKKTLFVILVATGLIIVVLYVLYTRVINKNALQDPTIDQTTSTAQTAQSDFTGGDKREPGSTTTDNKGSAEVSDTGGQDISESQSSTHISSVTGEITVHSPQKDGYISSGDLLSGTSKLSEVSYRIIDSVSGVIASGKLGVVKGKFSGTINFSSSASEGRIDIFGTKTDGSEYSNIEIPIKFK